MNKHLPCGHDDYVCVQYIMTDEDYDGVSEFRCIICSKRFGRWTLNELNEGELEPRLGEKRDEKTPNH